MIGRLALLRSATGLPVVAVAPVRLLSNPAAASSFFGTMTARRVGPSAFALTARSAPAAISRRSNTALNMSRYSQKRSMCTKPDGKSSERLMKAKHELTPMEQLKLQLPNVAVAVGGFVVVYGVSKMVMWLTSSFMSINFTTVGYLGFGCGVVTTVVSGLVGLYSFRLFRIRPEVAFRAAFNLLRQDERAIALLGGKLRAGHLRAYAIRHGKFGLDVNGGFAWLEPRVQMLFQVTGTRGSGMVSFEAIQHRGSMEFTVVTLDTLGEEREMIVVHGDASRLSVRGQLKEFLRSERAEYILSDDTK